MELILILLIAIFLFYKNGMIKGMIEEVKYPFSDDPERKYKKPRDQRIAQRKSRKTILFFVEVFITFVFFIGLIIYDYFDDSYEKDVELRKEIKGIYFCTDKQGNSERLDLGSTCFFSSYITDITETCNWNVENGTVKITFSEGNYYDGYKKKKEYTATIKDDKLYIEDKECKKIG